MQLSFSFPPPAVIGIFEFVRMGPWPNVIWGDGQTKAMICGPRSVRGSWPAGVPAGARMSVTRGAVLPTFILCWEATTMLFAVAGAGAFR